MSFLKQYGPGLLEKGYNIVPIAKGYKFPKGVKGWEQINATQDDLNTWVKKQFRNGGVGVLTKNTPAVDLDVHDQGVVEKLVAFCEDQFGHTVQRVGMAPKTLLVYRTDEPFTKVMSKTFEDVLGNEHRVEILGDGQQFVAFANHPETGRPYEWVSHDNLVTIDRKELPVLTHDDAVRIVDYFESIVPDHWEEKTNGSSGVAPINDESDLSVLDNLKSPLDVAPTRLELALKYIDADDYHQWVKVGMALFHQFNGSVDGFEMWENWSRKSDKFDPKGCEWKWETFKADIRKNPVTAATIIQLFKQARKEAKAEKRGVGEFGLVHASDILSKLKPVPWLIQGFVEQDSTGLLFGDPANYKSFLSIDMACHVAAGKEWHGKDVKQGPVIYLAGEGHNGFARRLAAWQSHHEDVDLGAIPLFFSLQAAQFYDADEAEKVTEKIDAIVERENTQPVMVVIDTLARNFGGGDENSTSDMNTFVNHVDAYLRVKYGCVVMIVHHTGKADKNNARGSSALKGAVDFEYRVDRPEDQDEMTCVMVNTKMKDAPQPPETWFQGQELIVGDFDEEITSLVFNQVEKPTGQNPQERLKGHQSALFNYIKKQCEFDGFVERSELRKMAVDHGVCRDSRQVRNILAELTKKQLIEVKDNEISVLDEFL